MEYVDKEWPSIHEVLIWTYETGRNKLLIDLVMLLVHYMDSRFLNTERLKFVRRAAEAAHQLDLKEDEALLRIDALGWTCVEEGSLDDAYAEIQRGLDIARQIEDKNTVNDLNALGLAWQARVMIEQEEQDCSVEASKLIKQAIDTPCSTVIQFRVNLAAGDIALKQGHSAEALEFYRKAVEVSEDYQGEGQGYQTHPRIGLAYLRSGNFEKAEEEFRILCAEDNIAIGKLYGDYGLALAAYKKGEKEEARRIAKGAKEELSRRTTTNLLLKLINKLFEDLEAGNVAL
jgi:LuxR family glucitol operon transcriptional activator